GIRDATVTGVQTCALPIFQSRVVSRWMVLQLLTTQLKHVDEHICKGGILSRMRKTMLPENLPILVSTRGIRLPGHLKEAWGTAKIGRASCRERVESGEEGE